MFRVAALKDRIQRANRKLRGVKFRGSAESVFLIDEAVLSGVSFRRAIAVLRDYGVATIHARALFPPLRRDCPYDVLEGSSDYWVGRSAEEDQEVAEELGANSFASLRISDLEGLSPRALCFDCL